MRDVAIIGAGPAGLATAICAALKGLSVEVFDRHRGPIDKACGEGLMPSGLAALGRMGVLAHLDPEETAAFNDIVYVDGGVRARGRLPGPALGVRRLALSTALQRRARELGVSVHEGRGVRSFRVNRNFVALETDGHSAMARLVVAADGLHSPSRQRVGLAGPTSPLRRFGLRQHFRIAPWARSVEVHFGEGVEAYVTPCGGQRVGVAFLWEADSLRFNATFESLLARFPELEARLRHAPPDGRPRGAGPLHQTVRRRVATRVALVGDAAGYVDAISGEGLSLGFEGAEALAAVLPRAMGHHGHVAAYAAYEDFMARHFAAYARVTRSLLWVARHRPVRKLFLHTLAACPGLFHHALALALGDGQRPGEPSLGAVDEHLGPDRRVPLWLDGFPVPDVAPASARG